MGLIQMNAKALAFEVHKEFFFLILISIKDKIKSSWDWFFDKAQIVDIFLDSLILL